MSKAVLIGAVCLFLFGSLNLGCASSSSFDSSLDKIIKPYSFSFAEWEIEVLSYELEDFLFGGGDETADDSPLVLEYFSFNKRISDLEVQIEIGGDSIEADELVELKEQLEELNGRKDALEDGVERIIQKQIIETLKQMGIFNPLDDHLNLEVSFPPVNFELEAPPHLLIVSPRDRIERTKEITLVQDISSQEREEIENAIDELGVSSIVVGLGGVATYPSFVIDSAGLQFTINVAIEEWLHQYLFFRPLGFMYSLHLAGITPNSEIAVMNETLVGIAREEIGAVLYQNYYSQYLGEVEENNQTETTQSDEPEFNFFKEMREIRLAVDDYLAQGEVEQAEAYMEQKRMFLASKGYYIRRLNQAYFAFYGTYAAGPISVNPIGIELKT
ncbi:MAG: hypothetical protein MUO92_00130, partial [Dehalococcoidales bacterium]|nr:hypothetical protein [Dehalococcoidales bacterium]